MLVNLTTGNGCISGRAGGETETVELATLESPLASVTRRCTTWLPAVVNVVLIPGPPTANAPVPVGSQANDVIGLDASVELETNDTDSPTRGVPGNQLNDAEGPAGFATAADGGVLTTNVVAVLIPTLPASSDCSARTA